MKNFLFLLFFVICSEICAQKIINKSVATEGNIQLAENISIPKTDAGYTLWLPEKTKAKGLVVFSNCRRDTINSNKLIMHALQQQLGVMYVCTENRLEFFFENEKMLELEAYIHEVITKYKIPKQNLFFAGMSLEGTRVLKLAIFSQSPFSTYHLKPSAIAICDAPLDMIRFYHEMKKAIKFNYHPIAVNEATWVSSYLEQKLGGSPLEQTSAYISYSPYCYLADGGPHLSAFKDISIRCYTEPDVDWWMKNRAKDYYGMNAIDLAAMVNALKLIGNENAELIITEDKGYLEDGTKHPHSWSIVDEKNLVDWFVKCIKD